VSEAVRAQALAERHLASLLPDRLRHVAGVASLAAETCTRAGVEADTVVAAAWLHDIGYSPELAATGFHPLDGARYVAEQGFDFEVARLVAQHSAAEVEAQKRGIADVLNREFALPDPRHLAVLTFADMQVGPTGQRVTVDARLEEIKQRYGPHALVTGAITTAEEQIRATVREVAGWVAAGQSQ
jgi:putative nucleotidyltransferase with HDIG domain